MNWLNDLIKFYDFIWKEGTALCGHHVNKQLMKDFEEGGTLFEEMKQKIIEKYPTEEMARKHYKKSK